MIDPALVRITLMTPADIPAVLTIENESHLEPWGKESFLSEMERAHSQLWTARRTRGDDAVLGYICFWIVADELQILNLAVAVRCRRQGIGRRLLHQAMLLGDAAGVRVAVLEVRKSNAAARKLYAGMGFQSVGERPDYYGVVREPAVLMELNLADYRRQSAAGNAESGRRQTPLLA